MRSFLFLFLSTICLLNSCLIARHTTGIENVARLKFLNEYDVPFNKEFQNTIIGGLSGIDYDPQKKVYYIISDDRSERNPARFYEAEIIINQNKIESVNFL